jgi:hypothetical protein
MSTTTIYRQLNANNVYESVTAAKTLTASDAGKTFLLPATGKAITLPAPIAGVNFKFICTATTAGTNWTITGGNSLIFGSAQVAGAVVAADAETTITLVIAKFLKGDWVSLESDGTNWYVEGSVVTAAGCTFA